MCGVMLAGTLKSNSFCHPYIYCQSLHDYWQNNIVLHKNTSLITPVSPSVNDQMSYSLSYRIENRINLNKECFNGFSCLFCFRLHCFGYIKLITKDLAFKP